MYTHRVQPYLKTILLGTAPISFIDQAIAKIFSLGMNKMGHEWINTTGICNKGYALSLEENILQSKHH